MKRIHKLIDEVEILQARLKFTKGLFSRLRIYREIRNYKYVIDVLIEQRNIEAVRINQRIKNTFL
jgi:hypothetical protein